MPSTLRIAPALVALVAPVALDACSPPITSQPDAESPLDAATAESGPRDASRPTVDVEVPDVAETPLPDFALTDLNSASSTAGMSVSLSAQRGRVSVWYFATAACQYCVDQVAQLQRMQRELDASTPTRAVRFFVIADLDSDGATSVFTRGNALPVLQDNRVANVQASWMAAIRDVVVVDDEGTRRLVYNLTTRPLTDAVYFNDLKARLGGIANR